MPARRQRRRRGYLYNRKKKSLNPKIKKYFLFGIFAAAVFLVAFLAFSLRTQVWDGKSRVSVAIENGTDGVVLAVLDPVSEQIISYSIPAATEVEAARQLGVWQIGSLWKLGQDEKVGGNLLSNTITKSLHLPTEAYASKSALGIIQGGVFESIISAIRVSSSSTNLTLGDRIRMAIFSSRLGSKNKIDIDMVDTGYLMEKRLPTGEDGFVVRNTTPSSLVKVFADSDVSKEQARIRLTEETMGGSLSRPITDVIETLGGKILSLERHDVSATDCEIWGTADKTIEKIAGVFSCKVVHKELTASFNVEMVVGADFEKRF